MIEIEERIIRYNEQPKRVFKMSWEETRAAIEEKLSQGLKVIFRDIIASLPMPSYATYGEYLITAENLPMLEEFIHEWFEEPVFKVRDYDWFRTPKTKKPKAGSPKPYLEILWSDHGKIRFDEHGLDMTDSWCGRFYSGRLAGMLKKSYIGDVDWVSEINLWREELGLSERAMFNIENIVGESFSCANNKYLAGILERAMEECGVVDITLLSQVRNPFEPELKLKTNAIHITTPRYEEIANGHREARGKAIAAYYASKPGGSYVGD